MKRLLRYAPLYREFRRLSRSLRFRVALSYVAFFAILVIAVGFILRAMLGSSLERELRVVIDEEWAAAKGYMRIVNYRPIWQYDRADPEESLIVTKITGGVYLLTDAKGKVLEISETYKGIPMSTQAEINGTIKKTETDWSYKKDEEGTRYLLHQGVMYDSQQRPYYMVIGKPLSEIETVLGTFTRTYSLVGILAILGGAIAGWLMAGRALTPLISVAQAASELKGTNLQVRIPLRGAGDELDRLIGSFNAMTERLAKSFEQIRQFSTDVSHELRTPLTGIRGQLEVAMFTASSPEQYREAILNALQDVEQLSNIVRALLLLSQAESGQLALQRQELDLTPLVRDLIEQFEFAAEDQKLKLQCELSAEGCIVNADRVQIGRLITNLVSNAIKYTPSGGCVKVGIRREGGFVQFIVSDTGVGIPAEDLPHIFDRFYRVRKMNTKGVQGLGLGLSFVSWIVEVHGGKIDVVSEEGQGTTFTVSLPAADASPIAGEPSAGELDSAESSQIN